VSAQHVVLGELSGLLAEAGIHMVGDKPLPGRSPIGWRAISPSM
jgi:polyphosphate kinase